MSRSALYSISAPEQCLLNYAMQKLFGDRPDLTQAQQSVISNILRANLASGRIYRFLNGHLLDQAPGPLEAYVTSVADYYLKENPDLLALQAGEAVAWLRLSDWLTRCAHVKLQQVKAFNGLSDRNARDFAQEISLWLLVIFSRTNHSLRDKANSPIGQVIGYTYDVPFSDWIAKVQSRRIVDAVRRSIRHDSIPVDLAEWIASGDVLEHVLECVLLGQEMSRLTLHQQRVMQLLVQGLNTQEVAKQLGCTDRAVYNCKHAAVNRLRKGLNQ